MKMLLLLVVVGIVCFFVGSLVPVWIALPVAVALWVSSDLVRAKERT
jgi:hypothetical protein